MEIYRKISTSLIHGSYYHPPHTRTLQIPILPVELLPFMKLLNELCKEDQRGNPMYCTQENVLNHQEFEVSGFESCFKRDSRRKARYEYFELAI